jgi:FAD/FMN-containing dehydrogenase
VLTAFALAIAADAQGPAYPGIPGYEPSVDFFEHRWQQSYWGTNYPRLAQIKRKYDPDGLFFVHNGVGSEQWTPDGFSRL